MKHLQLLALATIVVIVGPAQRANAFQPVGPFQSLPQATAETFDFASGSRASTMRYDRNSEAEQLFEYVERLIAARDYAGAVPVLQQALDTPLDGRALVDDTYGHPWFLALHLMRGLPTGTGDLVERLSGARCRRTRKGLAGGRPAGDRAHLDSIPLHACRPQSPATAGRLRFRRWRLPVVFGLVGPIVRGRTRSVVRGISRCQQRRALDDQRTSPGESCRDRSSLEPLPGRCRRPTDRGRRRTSRHSKLARSARRVARRWRRPCLI